MGHLPTISIVTPCLNRAGFIAEAIESVQQQNYPYVEHLIVDGGSTDGTLEGVGRYPHLHVSSEPDEGIYDALSKGIDRSHGEVIGFLNTDDLYEPGTLEIVGRTFADNPQADAVVGGASIFCTAADGKRTTLSIFPCVGQNELLLRSTQGAPVFNAWFFRRRLFDELGFFDCQYRYVADRDLLIRMALQDSPYVSLDNTLYHYRMHPGSYTLSGQDSGEAGYMFECRAVAERYLGLKGIGTEASDCLKAWHSQITMEHILTAWRRKAFGRATGYMLIGLRHNLSGWPTVFMRTARERFSILMAGDTR